MIFIFLYFIVSFSEGLLDFIGIGTIYTRIVCVSLILVFFQIVYNRNNLRINTFGLFQPLIFLFIISIISFLINGVGLISYLLFFIFVFVQPFFFFAAANYNFNQFEIKRLFKLIEVIFIIQIIVGIVKFFALGPSEDIIGTLTIEDGSLGAIFPALTISFYFMRYLFKRKVWDLFFIIGFMIFGISSDKRILLLILPILIISGLLLYNIKSILMNKGLNFKAIFTFILLATFFIYSSIRLMPTLNHENKVGGKFDLGFAVDYMINYNKSNPDKVSEMKRLSAFIYFPNLLIEKNIRNFLLGNGPGDTIGSRLKNNKEDPMLEKYGVRYGGRTTFVWLLLQVGILGFITMVWFYLKLFNIIYKTFIISNNINIMVISTSLILFLLILTVDVMIYSNSFFKSYAVMGIFNLFSGLLLNYVNYQINQRHVVIIEDEFIDNKGSHKESSLKWWDSNLI